MSARKPYIETVKRRLEDIEKKSYTIEYLIAVGSIGLMLGTMVIGIVGVLFGKSSMHSVWAPFHQFQFLLLIPTLNIWIPAGLKKFIGIFQFTSLDFNFMKRLRIPDYEAEYVDPHEEEVEGFTIKMGVLKFLLVIFILHLILLPITWMNFLKKRSYIGKVRAKLSSIFNFGIYIRFFLITSLPVLLTTGADVSAKLKAEDYGLSFITSVAFLGVYIALSLAMPIHFFFFRKNLQILENGFFKEIYHGIKVTEMLPSFYSSIFFLRRLALASIILFLRDCEFWIKMPIFLGLQTLIVAYSVGIMPFKRLKDNIIEGINETSYFLIVTLVTMYYREDQWDSSKSTLILMIALFNTLALFVANLSGTSIELRHMFKQDGEEEGEKGAAGKEKKKRHTMKQGQYQSAELADFQSQEDYSRTYRQDRDSPPGSSKNILVDVGNMERSQKRGQNPSVEPRQIIIQIS